VDVTTHLGRLVQWELSDQIIDRTDIEMVKASAGLTVFDSGRI